jgi:hypothetical protein
MKAKTMISIHHPLVLEFRANLMQHSKNDVIFWCIKVMESMLIPCLQRHHYDVKECNETLDSVKQWLNKEVKFAQVKPKILILHEQARHHNQQPIVMGCIRAIAHGCSSVHAQAHAMGVIYYGAFALAKEQCENEDYPCLEVNCEKFILEMINVFRNHHERKTYETNKASNSIH